MPILKKQLFTCDCPGVHYIHAGEEDESRDGWFTAFVEDGGVVTDLELLRNVPDDAIGQSGRLFFFNFDHFKRWANEFFFPPKPAEEATPNLSGFDDPEIVPVPKPEKAAAEDNDIPF